ncbi:extracellular solute-binding protein [Alkalihalobacillus oceani]|uniref:extracellular solute-binding protein n=1 Tax=Halalkalibacter oceani TaxID=1653776 RepID=UPI00203C410F|nr:extracellular solute-binding protein [Halalkalibacter oceani]MCM3759209.1 extracellular solute-binding protein [Halalkalibacter oceani]
MSRTALLCVILLGSSLLFFGCRFQGGIEGKAILSEESAEQVITVYSARHYGTDTDVFEAYTDQTGIQVLEVKGTAEELVQRLVEEGEDTNADLFITADGGILYDAKQRGILQPFDSETIREQVPEQWRDPDDEFVALTTRARVLVYAKDRVDPSELSTYEALADDKWEGRLLVRSSSNLYNQSLLAFMVESLGRESAFHWAEGLVHNLARQPEGGDRAQAKAVANGVGDVAIVNTYYIGQMLASANSEEVRAAENLGVFFPNQQTTGTHMNISGAGLVQHAPNREEAVKLIEFMTGVEGQTLLTQGSFEFPINNAADKPPLLDEWDGFHRQSYSFEQLYKHHNIVKTITEQAGWN